VALVIELVFDPWESEEVGLIGNLSIHNACFVLFDGASDW